jgi:hypothetical protein
MLTLIEFVVDIALSVSEFVAYLRECRRKRLGAN